MSDRRDHPVWEVYQLHRDYRFNLKYWNAKLSRHRSFNFWLEFSLAVTAPGSAVTGLVFWNTQSGGIFWGILITLTALLGVAKPLLNLSNQIMILQKVVTGYQSLDSQVEQLAQDVKRTGAYSAELMDAFKKIQAREQEITRDEPTGSMDERLRDDCYAAVNRELPAAAFYVPTADT